MTGIRIYLILLLLDTVLDTVLLESSSGKADSTERAITVSMIPDHQQPPNKHLALIHIVHNLPQSFIRVHHCP